MRTLSLLPPSFHRLASSSLETVADLHAIKLRSATAVALPPKVASTDIKTHTSKSSRKSVDSNNSAAAVPLVAMLMSHVQQVMTPAVLGAHLGLSSQYVRTAELTALARETSSRKKSVRRAQRAGEIRDLRAHCTASTWRSSRSSARSRSWRQSQAGRGSAVPRFRQRP